MREQLVSLNVARLLREKGFRLITLCYYDEEESIIYNPGDWNAPLFKGKINSAPTQSLAQKWLREEKDIIVIVNYNCVGCAVWNYKIFTNKTDIRISDTSFSTYEEALEAGLIETLKLV